MRTGKIILLLALGAMLASCVTAVKTNIRIVQYNVGTFTHTDIPGGSLDMVVSMMKELKPDVIVMDLMMPKMSGADATVEILKENPAAKVLMLTTFGTSQEIRKMLDAGVAGALVKTSSQAEIIDAIRSVVAGRHVISKEISNSLKVAAPDAPKLSSRQIEVMNLVAKGFANNDIARILNISVNSVKDHLKNIYTILDVSSRTEAATIAINLKLISV